MVPKKGKERKGKAGCDLCGRESPPIHEYQYFLHTTLSHWIDLCDLCGAVDRPIRNGFVVGIHANAPPTQNQTLTRARHILCASGPENGDFPVQRNKRTVATIVEG